MSGRSDPEGDLDSGHAQMRRGRDDLDDELREARRRIEQLEEAVASNRRIGMAIGILMALTKTSDTGAFELLRQQSMAMNRRVRVIAEYVIDVGELPAKEARGELSGWSGKY